MGSMEEMDELRDKVIAVINEAVSLNPEEVTTLINHLFSPAVMLRKFEDLQDIDAKMLEGVIGSLPAKKLLLAFNKENNSGAERREEIRSSQQSQQAQSQETQPDDQFRRLSFNENEFSYTVNWKDMPIKVLKNLDKKNKEKAEGDPADISDLKNAVAAKLLVKYAAFLESHPSVTQRSPGRRACLDAAIQIVAKFKFAMRDELNGVVHGNGIETLCKMLIIKTQNVTRRDRSEAPTTMRGKGVPGVLESQYKPSMTKAEKISQTRVKKELVLAYTVEEEDRDWHDITAKMNDTYELQRELIVEVTRGIKKRVDLEEEDEDQTEDNSLEEKMILKVMNNWPFLFALKPMNNHHKRLTGHNLEERLNAYMADPNNLDYLIKFMKSSSSANLKNVVLFDKMERRSNSPTNGSKLLLAVCMLANHFKEDYSTFLLTVEETTKLDEVLAAKPSLPSSICILGLGRNALVADNYFITLDQIGVTETRNAGNALLMLIELCFILDIEYPPALPRTFEFIERIILELTVSHSRVRDKKKKILLVLSEAVRTTGKKFSEFQTQMRENLGDSDSA